MLGVIDGLVEQRCNMLIEQCVADAAPGAGRGHQAHHAQQTQLVGDRGLFQSERVGQLAHGQWVLVKLGQDEQPTRGDERLECLPKP